MAGGWFHANDFQKTCGDFLEAKEFEIKLPSKFLVSLTAGLFSILLLSDLFIFVKYLAIRSKFQRVSMIVFYLLTLLDLTGRTAIMISLNFKPFFAMENLVLSVICLELALFVGASNAYILTSLTIDLKTLKCANEAELQQLRKMRIGYRVFHLIWAIGLVVSAIMFFFIDNYEYIMLMEAIMFTVQAVGLLVINAQLNRTLSSIFGPQQL